MNSKKPIRALILLASSGLNESELGALAEWCERYGERRLVGTVLSLRMRQRQLTADLLDDDRNQSERRLSASRSPSEDIATLLRRDTGLSATHAAELLVDRLRKRTDLPSGIIRSIPVLGKSAFDTWVTRLSRLVPYSVLLQEATLIRNDLTHLGGDSDWPLKRDDV